MADTVREQKVGRAFEINKNTAIWAWVGVKHA